MNVYTPRPGSKTAAAVDYLLAHGAAATAIDIAEACDSERKNLPACFKAAIDNGLLEVCDLPEGKGYRLRGLIGDGEAAPTLDEALARTLKDDDDATATPPAVITWPEPVAVRLIVPKKAKRAAVGKKSLSAARPTAATEIRPYLGAMPKTQPGKPRKPKPPAADHIRGEGKMVAPSFRIGHYSDGSVRLEGLSPTMIITDGAGELPNSVMLAPEAALLVARFLGAPE